MKLEMGATESSQDVVITSDTSVWGMALSGAGTYCDKLE